MASWSRILLFRRLEVIKANSIFPALRLIRRVFFFLLPFFFHDEIRAFHELIADFTKRLRGVSN